MRAFVNISREVRQMIRRSETRFSFRPVVFSSSPRFKDSHPANNRAFARGKNEDIGQREQKKKKGEREKALREKEVGKPLPSLRLEQTARFGCTVTVLFNTRRDTKETDIKMEKSTRHASNTVNERQTRYRFPIARAEVCHDKLRWTSSKSCYSAII